MIVRFDKFYAETRVMVASLRKYLEITEAQLEEAQRLEDFVVSTQGPRSPSEEDIYLFSIDKHSIKELFEGFLAPALRYTATMLLHSAFETRLIEFCFYIKEKRRISEPFKPKKGGYLTINSANSFLTKFGKLPVEPLPGWQPLNARGKVRNCIAHQNGNLEGFKDAPTIDAMIAEGCGLGVDAKQRLIVSRSFCQQHVDLLDTFFQDLFQRAKILA